MVQPRNYLLFACHAANESAQIYQLGRWAGMVPDAEPETPKAEGVKVEKNGEAKV